MPERARALWVELERVAAGYATRGFAAALEVCRARRDDVGLTRWREILDEIYVAFNDQALADLQRAVAMGDPEIVTHLLVEREITSIGSEVVERALCFLCDQRVLPVRPSSPGSAATCRPRRAWSSRSSTASMGLRSRDSAAFGGGAAAWRTAGARPAIGAWRSSSAV